MIFTFRHTFMVPPKYHSRAIDYELVEMHIMRELLWPFHSSNNESEQGRVRWLNSQS